VEPGGVGQALTQAFHGDFPDYSFGVSLQIPIRNRSAQADHARALLDQRQIKVSIQRNRNQIEQEVRNAIIALTQAKAQIQAAEKAVVLSEKTLDAEQIKYKLGESTVFLVIQAQRDLDAARLNLNESRATYAKALTELHQATGTTLEENNIQVSDARTGKLARTPNIPGSRE
jgi:outer membrane protein TolC